MLILLIIDGIASSNFWTECSCIVIGWCSISYLGNIVIGWCRGSLASKPLTLSARSTLHIILQLLLQPISNHFPDHISNYHPNSNMHLNHLKLHRIWQISDIPSAMVCNIIWYYLCWSRWIFEVSTNISTHLIFDSTMIYLPWGFIDQDFIGNIDLEDKWINLRYYPFLRDCTLMQAPLNFTLSSSEQQQSTLLSDLVTGEF